MSGIENFGLHCYASSLIQCICHSSAVMITLGKHHDMHTIPDPHRTCLRCLLYDMANRINSQFPQAISFHPTKPLMQELGVSLLQTGDPRELYVMIVNTLLPEFQVEYGFAIKTTVTCTECHTSNEQETLQIEIEIPEDSSSVSTGIAAYLADVELDDYQCTTCDNFTHSVKETTFQSLPKILTVHCTGAQPKVPCFILDIGNNRYMLEGFIELITGKRGYASNHYVAYKRYNHVWLVFDDSTVKKASFGREFRINLAFYRNTETTYPLGFKMDMAQFKAQRIVKPRGRAGQMGAKSSKVIDIPKPEPVPASTKQATSTISTPAPEPIGGGNPAQQVSEEPMNVSSTLASDENQPSLPPPEPCEIPSQSQQSAIQQQLHEPVTQETFDTTQSVTVPAENKNGSENSSAFTSNIQVGTSMQQQDPTVSSESQTTSTPTENQPTTSRLIGHVEYTSEEDFRKENISRLKMSRLLVVSIKKYPNLLKRHQEGNVTIREMRPQHQRLCKIRKRHVSKEDILDLDVLAHQTALMGTVTVHAPDDPHDYTPKNPVSSDDSSDSGDSTEPYGMGSQDDIQKVSEEAGKMQSTRSSVYHTRQLSKNMVGRGKQPKMGSLSSSGKPVSTSDAGADGRDEPSRGKGRGSVHKKPVKSTAIPSVGRITGPKQSKATSAKPERHSKRSKPVHKPLKSTKSINKKSAKKLLKAIEPRNVRRDGVDERCARLGIKYLKWQGERGEGLHISHEPTSTVLIDYLPRGQKVNEDCILCPQEIHPISKYDLNVHVRRVHVAKLITIRDTNLLMCRCSDIRSQGCDNSVRNRHWHCIECWHPFTTPAKLKVHILAKHKDDYTKQELNHLDKSRGGP